MKNAFSPPARALTARIRYKETLEKGPNSLKTAAMNKGDNGGCCAVGIGTPVNGDANPSPRRRWTAMWLGSFPWKWSLGVPSHFKTTGMSRIRKVIATRTMVRGLRRQLANLPGRSCPRGIRANLQPVASRLVFEPHGEAAKAV